ncbi:MAG: undecaprenyldiphospho-muramoylpentapeptide beta-N-acetylglucosaminyltransferase [Bacteroidales bacterium]|nr:undecaprenyldiphospho-muramoylpentapeptide beta-N-acetylglucosaminyltransferase [Bacteroidales bacterium]
MLNRRCNSKKLVVSGGGTGGHIFPALSVALEFRSRYPDAEVLYIGAKGRMEMEKAPAAGFRVIGLWISGMERKLSMRSLIFPVKLTWSLLHATAILIRFKPCAVAGFGGYASGSTLKAASMLGIPVLIQEQNSIPGKTNKLLAKSAKKVCVAFGGMEKYFDKNKIVMTGNPVRKEMLNIEDKRDEAIRFFDLDRSRPMILVVGGSQGALAVNRAVETHLGFFRDEGIQLIWQTGKHYFTQAGASVSAMKLDNVKPFEFIRRMDLAYAASDLVISRAGAIAMSEIALAGKPAVFVPLPSAAENHQMINALAFAEREAAWVIRDNEVRDQLAKVIKKIINDTELLKRYGENIKRFSVKNAAERIVDELEKLMG